MMQSDRRRQRTFSNSSLDSVDSTYSFNSSTSLESTTSLDSLLTQPSLPCVFQNPSATRNLQLRNEVKSIRHQIESNCRKTTRRPKQKKGLDKMIVHYGDWDKWLRKHKKGTEARTVGGLSEGEFKLLFTWFSSRMKNNPDGVRGIKVASVVDEFMLSGLYEDRAEAYSFVCKIDTKRNGEVTFDNFIAAFQDKDFSQLYVLKKFVKRITPKTSRASTSHSSRHGRGNHRAGGERRAHSPSLRVACSSPPLSPLFHAHPPLPSSPLQRNNMSPAAALSKSKNFHHHRNTNRKQQTSTENNKDTADMCFPLLTSPIKRPSLQGEAPFV